MDLSQSTAYGGGRWAELERRTDFVAEKDEFRFWRNSGVDSEYGKLREVLLRLPGREMELISDADAVQFLERPDPGQLCWEVLALARVFKEFDVTVHLVDHPMPSPNLLYMRDLFLATRGLTFLARPATEIRAGEECAVAEVLSGLKVPLHTVMSGIFEASDVLFVRPDEIFFGYGNRSAPQVVEEILVNSGSPCLRSGGSFLLPRATQHLLGVVNIVAEDTVLVRRIVPENLMSFLKSRFEKIVLLEETQEVIERQAMNVVTVSPRQIIMPDDCPETSRLFRLHGLRVIEVCIKELRKGAGGLACATGILRRDAVA